MLHNHLNNKCNNNLNKIKMNYTTEIVIKIKELLPFKGMQQISDKTGIPYQTIATEFSRIKDNYNPIIMDAAIEFLKEKGYDTEKTIRQTT